MLPGLLTKKSTQEEITAATNASVLVRGRYTPPGDTSNSERPLHLHIEARTQEEIDRAVEMVHSLMGGPPSSATSTSTPTLVSPPPPMEASVGVEGATPLPSLNMAAPMPSPRGNAPQRPEMIRHTIDVGLDSNAGYQIRGKLLGPKGSYLKHIQDQTGVRVQLAGKVRGRLLPLVGAQACGICMAKNCPLSGCTGLGQHVTRRDGRATSTSLGAQCANE